MSGGARFDEEWMQRALELALQAEARREVPVGAVLVAQDGTVLAEAANASIRLHDATAHAEILAIRAAGSRLANYRLPGCTIYVTLEPCSMCVAAMVHARLERVVFGAHDLKTGACGSVFSLANDSRMNHRMEVTAGVMADQCGQILKEFFRARR
jgi:tRNA(adenine34) deaminase